MRMGEQDRIQVREVIQRDAWRCDPRKKPTQCPFEIRIRQDPSAGQLQEQCRMTNIGNLQTPSWIGC